MLAALTENGACWINEDGLSTRVNEYAWNSVANVIYVDQPADVGFSYSDAGGLDHNETQVADDMLVFFEQFYQAFPNLVKNPLFITGESYAGHYTVAVAHRIWQYNQQGGNNLVIPLGGVAVGNGLTDPLLQYQAYAPMAYTQCQLEKGQPCVSKSAYEQMQQALPQCLSMIQQCQADVSTCATAESFCNNAMIGPYQETGLNPYNIMLQCQVQPLCYDMTDITTFLNNVTIQTALNVRNPGSINWQPCNFDVNGDFGSDWMRDFNGMVPDLLASNLRFWTYAGDLDFIVNWLGVQRWTVEGIEWPGKAAFNATQPREWMNGNTAAGTVRSYKNLAFVRGYNGGHMYPADQPANALHMISTFLSGGNL